MEIGFNIARLRKDREVTQEQLAKAVGVSAPAVSKWETGQSLPDIGLLAPLARYFGVTVDELLAYERQLSDEEVDRRTRDIQKIFSRSGYEAGMAACKALAQEYPDNAYLRMKLAGMASLYVMYARKADRTEEHIKQFCLYALELLEEIISRGDGRYYMQALGMAAVYRMQNGDYETSERYLKQLPPQEVTAEVLYPPLYLLKKDWEKAEIAGQQNVDRFGRVVLQSLGAVMRAAWEREDDQKLRRVSKQYTELERMFGYADGLGNYYRTILALKTGKTEEADREFRQYVERILTYPWPADMESRNAEPAGETADGAKADGTKADGVKAARAVKIQQLENALELIPEDEKLKGILEREVFGGCMEDLKHALQSARRQMGGEDDGK